MVTLSEKGRRTGPGLDNMAGSVSVSKGNWFRRLLVFVGPAYLVSVGYMDPGNWATDIEGGARFGYTLVWVLLMSNLMAILLQTLSARLGIVTGYDLAQGCRREYPRPVSYVLWALAEVAIAATDLAEVLGTIIGLNLLLGLPLLWGVVVTVFDTFLLLAIQRMGVRKMEGFIVMLIGTIGAAFFIEVFLAAPDWGGIARGFVPHLEPGALYIAIGIIGATVMPHNLYLHSSLVQSRAVSNTVTGKAEACRYNFIDSAVALNAAFFVNAAILVMSAATFYRRGIVVTEIQQAYRLLEPILGTTIAPMAFGIALLAAGQSSTLTGTISGQIVMEGFLNFKLRPWLRRLLTRSAALIPAALVIGISGNVGTYKLLILSQVILSLQLPFAIIPLIHFTADRKKMGSFASALWVNVLAWLVAGVIVVLNLLLAWQELNAWLAGASLAAWVPVGAVVLGLLTVLAYITAAPFVGVHREWESGVATDGRKIAADIRPIKLGRIGIALEHSPTDAEIISAALPLATIQKARIVLLHVSETPGAMMLGEATDTLHRREDQAYLEELAREIEEKELPVETLLRAGDPVEELIKAVELMKLDLLVLGAHGHRGLEDLVFGQTVHGVRHAIDIPVLVVRLSTFNQERPQKRDR